MIELTSAGDKRARFYNPDKIVSVGSFMRPKIESDPNGGTKYGKSEDGEQVNYILLEGADEVDPVLETNSQVLFLMQAWRNRTQYSGSSLALSVSLGAIYGGAKPSPYFRQL